MDREQAIIGTVFAGMGLGTMLFPNFLIPLCFAAIPNAQDPYLVLTFRCFGAQASLVGLLILSCRFTQRTYRNFGLAMLPFFAFDYFAWNWGYASTLGAIGDLAGNVVFTSFSWMGYQRMKSHKKKHDSL